MLSIRIILSLLLPFFFCISCHDENQKNRKADNFEELIIDTNDYEFSTFWNNFSYAVIQNDKTTIKELSSECIYCTDCVTNTNVEDSLFNILRDKNNEIWFDTLYNFLSYIPLEKFISEDFNIIFNSTVQNQLLDKSKIGYLKNTYDTILNMPICLKNQLNNNYIEKKEILISFTDKLENGEGYQIALGFIKTKKGYKFFSYYTIP